MQSNIDRRLYYKQAIQEIENRGVAPAYLLYGEEILLSEKIIKQIKDKFLAQTVREINYFVRYASEDGVDEVISLGSGMGLFTDKKLIVLKESHKLKKAEIEKINKFIEKLRNDICIIFHAPVTSLYQVHLKNISKRCVGIYLLPLREGELKDFIRTEFKKYEKVVTDDAIELLTFMVGNQLADLLVQINNVSQYHVDKQKIDIAEIEQIAGVYVTQDVFEYIRYIGNRNLEKALFVLHNLLESGVSEQQIIFQLLRHFSIVWKVQGFYRSGVKNKDKICKELKIYPKYFREYDHQSRTWESNSIKKAFKLLHESDRELKDDKLSTKIALDMLSYRVINC